MGVCQGKPHREFQRKVNASKSMNDVSGSQFSIPTSEAQNRAALRNYYGTLIEKEKAKYAPELTLNGNKLYISRLQAIPKPRSTPDLRYPNNS